MGLKIPIYIFVSLAFCELICVILVQSAYLPELFTFDVVHVSVDELYCKSIRCPTSSTLLLCDADYNEEEVVEVIAALLSHALITSFMVSFGSILSFVFVLNITIHTLANVY